MTRPNQLFERLASLTTAELVREAVPIARSLVAIGVESVRRDFESECVTDLVEQLTGIGVDSYVTVDDAQQLVRVELVTQAAFAIGLAAGTLMRPEAFGVSTAQPALPLHDPSQWPERMTREQVAAVHQRSVSWLRGRVAAHRYPAPDSDGRWSRDIVREYAQHRIKDFDKAYARRRPAKQLSFGRNTERGK